MMIMIYFNRLLASHPDIFLWASDSLSFDLDALIQNKWHLRRGNHPFQALTHTNIHIYKQLKTLYTTPKLKIKTNFCLKQELFILTVSIGT